MKEVEKMVNFRPRSVQRLVILLEQNRIDLFLDE